MSETTGKAAPLFPCLEARETMSAEVVSNAEQKKISSISYGEAHERVMLKLKAVGLRQKVMQTFRTHMELAELETRNAREELEELEARLQGRVPVVIFQGEGVKA